VSRAASPATAPAPGPLLPVLLALAFLAGCTAPGQPTSGQPPAAASDYDSYVALGDSFTSAPFVPTTDLAEGCLRSDGNYPALLAERLRVTDVTDVSCSGARTVDLTRPQRTVGDSRVPPQLDAVGAGTDLVTVGIGGNDFDLFGACVRLQARPSSGSCAEALSGRGVDVFARARRIRGRVAAAVGAVRARAPEATVVVVGYPRLTPDRGTCPQLPFGAADRTWARRVERALRAALRQAAADSGAVFADVYAASAGHDVCAAVPWVNGRRTDRQRALAFHPFVEGQEAAAEVVEAALDRQARRTR
jgi:lysophospholipase L1-like esterase